MATTTTKTRSGRLVKKPERYEPIEKVEDDFSSDEYDSDTDDDNDSDIPSEYTEEEDSSDSEGSLVDFIVPDESESEIEEEE
jgi:hypothetical protein